MGLTLLPPPTTTTTLHPIPTLGTAPSQVSRPGLWALVRGSRSGHCCRQERVIPLVPLTPQCHAECHATTLSPVLRWHVGPAPWRVPSQNGDVSWRLHALTVTSGSGQVCRRGWERRGLVGGNRVAVCCCRLWRRNRGAWKKERKEARGKKSKKSLLWIRIIQWPI